MRHILALVPLLLLIQPGAMAQSRRALPLPTSSPSSNSYADDPSSTAYLAKVIQYQAEKRAQTHHHPAAVDFGSRGPDAALGDQGPARLKTRNIGTVDKVDIDSNGRPPKVLSGLRGVQQLPELGGESGSSYIITGEKPVKALPHSSDPYDGLSHQLATEKGFETGKEIHVRAEDEVGSSFTNSDGKPIQDLPSSANPYSTLKRGGDVNVGHRKEGGSGDDGRLVVARDGVVGSSYTNSGGKPLDDLPGVRDWPSFHSIQSRDGVVGSSYTNSGGKPLEDLPGVRDWPSFHGLGQRDEDNYASQEDEGDPADAGDRKKRDVQGTPGDADTRRSRSRSGTEGGRKMSPTGDHDGHAYDTWGEPSPIISSWDRACRDDAEMGEDEDDRASRFDARHAEKITGVGHMADGLPLTNAKRMRLGLPLKPPPMVAIAADGGSAAAGAAGAGQGTSRGKSKHTLGQRARVLPEQSQLYGADDQGI